MLGTQPPGFNASAINQQNNQLMAKPGPQGGTAQGDLAAHQYSSAYSAPSNYAYPSSIPTQNSVWGGDPNGVSAMIAALSRGV